MGGTCQDTERQQLSKGHLLPGDHIRRNLSGHRKKVTQARGTHQLETTLEGHVRTQKESNQEKGTHTLETTLEGTCQDTEREQPSKGHSQTGESIRRDFSGQEKKVTEPEQGVLTTWRSHQEGLVRTWKKSNWARGTHILETTSEDTCQDTERK